MAEDKLQEQRLELKYLIREDIATRLRDYIRSYLEPDENSPASRHPDGSVTESTGPEPEYLKYSYPVHSLYLDSANLKLYWETINGTKNRFKLRLRYYDTRPEAPVFFEIKRRMNNCILKQRGGVRRDSVDWLLAGHLPDPSHLTSQSPRNLVALQTFCHRMISLHARPKAHVAYMREAWITTSDNSVRVTMDREVKCEPEFTTRLSTELTRPVFAFGDDVILELKFTVAADKQSLWNRPADEVMLTFKRQYPMWFPDMVRHFNLTQTGVAKYVEGIDAVGAHLFQENGHVSDWPVENNSAGPDASASQSGSGVPPLYQVEAGATGTELSTPGHTGAAQSQGAEASK